MKKNSFTYRTIALTLAFLMFFTSVGYTVDMHYCQGELKTFNLFGKAKTCHEMEQGKKECPHHKKMLEASGEKEISQIEKDCCSNQTLYIQMDEEQQHQAKTALEANPSLPYFAIAFVEIFLKETLVETENPSYTHYQTPLIPMDIYVLLETYQQWCIGWT